MRLSPVIAAVLAVASAPAVGDSVKLRVASVVLADSKGAPLVRPEGVACNGKLLAVADTGNGRIVLYDVNAQTIAARSEMSVPEAPQPVRVAIAPDGGLVVLDGKSHRLVRLSPAGEARGFVETGSAFTRALRIDAAGDLYLLDVAAGRVRILTSAGAVKGTIAIPSEARSIVDLSVDAAGTVYLLDAAGSRIFAAKRGESAATPWGNSLKEDLDFGGAIAADTGGRIFVADSHGGGIVTLGVDGSFRGRQSAWGWGDGELRYPASICADGAGSLFVADRGNSRVQMFQVVP